MNLTNNQDQLSRLSDGRDHLLGIIYVKFSRKFKIRRLWRNRYRMAKCILVEYNNGRFYRAYRPDSTVHKTGEQLITALLFFSNYDTMAEYIKKYNLPTELYHTYSATNVSSNTFVISDYKIRYNRAERIAYLTLPTQNHVIKDTDLRIGDTVNLQLNDRTTNTIQNVSFHRILSKEHNYCAIRLTPTATEYFKRTYRVDIFPILATGQIELIIERIENLPRISKLRYQRVNFAKPALLEEIFRAPKFLETLSKELNLGCLVKSSLNFGPDGRQRPDIELRTLIDNTQQVQVIGECKAVGQMFSQRALEHALIQLLFYKTKEEYENAHFGLLVVTGNSASPNWTQIKELVQKYSQRDYKVKLHRYSHTVHTVLYENAHFLRNWCQNYLFTITGDTIRRILRKLPNKKQNARYSLMLDFIEN